MMKRVILLATLLLICATMVGCMHTRYEPSPGRMVSMTSSLGANVKILPGGRPVKEEYMRKWLLWFIVPIGDDGGDMIDDIMGGSEAMINCRIKAEWDFLDLVINAITFGILSTRSVEISGTLVNIQRGVPTTAAPAGGTTVIVTTPSAGDTGTTGNVKLCPHCGRGNEMTSKFCRHCGKSMLPVGVCPKCSTQNRADAKYCTKCGTAMPTQ